MEFAELVTKQRGIWLTHLMPRLRKRARAYFACLDPLSLQMLEHKNDYYYYIINPPFEAQR